MSLCPIYFDTETTGTSTEKDRIVEIAAFNPIKQESFSQLVNPQMPMPKESTMVNKITDEMLKDAPTLDVVAKEFIAFCPENAILIAHNCDSFDRPLLEAEFKRIQISTPSTWQYFDTLKWARKYRRDLPRHSLQYLREVYGVNANQAHRALDDVMVLYNVFNKMIDDLPIEKVVELLTENSPKLLAMPFGRHKGTLLKDLTPDYISWLKKNGILAKKENKALEENLQKLGLL